MKFYFNEVFNYLAFIIILCMIGFNIWEETYELYFLTCIALIFMILARVSYLEEENDKIKKHLCIYD